MRGKFGEQGTRDWGRCVEISDIDVKEFGVRTAIDGMLRTGAAELTPSPEFEALQTSKLGEKYPVLACLRSNCHRDQHVTEAFEVQLGDLIGNSRS